MILCGDIGGTHARLALAQQGTANLIATKQYPCSDHGSLTSILTDYLATLATPPSAGCLAVAGPISEDGRQATLTNLPWALDCDQLEAASGIARIRLVNDFAAAAMGVTAVAATDLVTLQAGQPLPSAPRLVLGAGTGLGMAILLADSAGWRILPGEGGHVGLSPQQPRQLAVWQALLDQHGRVTAERAISGPGLAAIHHILTGEQLSPADVSRLALIGDSLAARRSIDMFMEFYGAFAGDMAMLALARGGVFLAGGVMAKLLPLVASSPFLAAFNAKAEHQALVGRMPVYAVVEPQLGLKGAALLAGS
jgi:glucokinase